ncbi:hypothetical protein TSUKUMMB_15170 [Rhodococcus sp. no. 34]
MRNQVSVVKFHDGDRALRPATSKGGGAECFGIWSVRPSLQFGGRLSEQAACDDQLLDLLGALEDVENLTDPFG